VFGSCDVDHMLEGFTDDVVARFGDRPEMHGILDVEAFLRARFNRQRSYRLTKQLRMLAGNMIGNVWDAEWEDALSGKMMRGHGVEFWTMRDRKIAVWEAAFNVWEKGAPPPSPFM